MSNDSRVPSGVPTGGQFAASNKSESEAILSAHTVGSQDEFDARYTLQGDLDGDLLDEDQLAGAEANHIWTVLDTDGTMYVVAGTHMVNRLGYVLSEQPWTDESEEYYWGESPAEEMTRLFEDASNPTLTTGEWAGSARAALAAAGADDDFDDDTLVAAVDAVQVEAAADPARFGQLLGEYLHAL